MKAGRTTDIARIIPLLGAFVGAAVVLGVLGAGLVMPTVGTIGAVTRTGVDMFDALPSEFTAATLSQQSTILDSKGGVIARPYDENRIIVPLASVAPIMQKAQVAIEDDRFYEHGGVDVRGLVRAVVSNASNETVQGGSTLTQQYVKLQLQESALQSGDPAAAQAAVARSGLAGVTRKLQELKYSIQLEKVKSKDQILESYFNIVYYGDQAYGVEAASRHYFNKSAKDLTLPEAALIAGLAQSPGTTDPVHFPDRAFTRRNVVLDRMHELGLITTKEWTDARAVKLADMLHVTQAPSACQAAGDTAYFCDYVIKWLELDPSLNQALGTSLQARKDKIFGGGLTIQTTIDPALSQAAKAEILKRVPESNKDEIGSAAVTLDPNTGAVKGMAQNSEYSGDNSDFSHTQVNWGVDSQYGGSNGFGFGSTEKAFALVTALQRGYPINTTLSIKGAGPSVAASYTNADFSDACGIPKGARPWTVRNDETVAAGPMTLTQATAQSINTAFVALVSQLGACNVRDTEALLGLHQANGQPIQPYPSAITLGSDPVSPMTVASAYGSMANSGVHCTPTPIQQITGPDGKELPIVKPGTGNCTKVVDPSVADGVAQIMTSVMTGTGTGAQSALSGGRPAAGKTGTTNGNRQTWFVGYTPQLTTAVWVGQPLGNKKDLDRITLAGTTYSTVFGKSIAAPIWKAIMDIALQGQPNEPFPAAPDTIVNGDKVAISGVSGMTIANATAQLASQGFAVTVGRRVNSNYPVGTVAYTSATGGQANRGTSVTLYISVGPAPRPAPVRPAPPAQPSPPPAAVPPAQPAPAPTP